MTFTRVIERMGLEVSALGMGTWALGGPYFDARGKPLSFGGFPDDQRSLLAIRRALDLGVTFFDTADCYGAGHSEALLGTALQGRRQQVFIATKFGNVFDPATRRELGTSASPAYIRRALEQSLRRLGTDYVDLYQFHLWGYPPSEAPAVQETLERLCDEGKIRGYAWSTDVLEGLEVFARGPRCVAVNHELNLMRWDPALVALCERERLLSVNRSPLAMGILSGRYRADFRFPADDIRSHTPWYSWLEHGHPSPHWLERLASVQEVLRSGGRTLAQGALAWIWALSPRTVPIPGARSPEQAEENARAMDFGPLTSEQMSEVEVLLEASGPNAAERDPSPRAGAYASPGPPNHQGRSTA